MSRVLTRAGMVCLAAGALALGSSCTFDSSGLKAGVNGNDSGSGGDASTGGIDASVVPPPPDGSVGTPDGSVTPPPDGAVCTFGSVDVCSEGAPAGTLTISSNETFDTGSDPRCADFPQSGGPEACLLFVEGFTIEEGVTFTAIGGRPLLVVSVGDIQIDGTLDVSSQRGVQTGAGANYSGCSVAQSPQSDLGGGGGGAGGSFGTAGGDGGTGDTDTTKGHDGSASPGLAGPTDSSPAFARGGCPGDTGGDEWSGGGQGGSGGDSGGAVLLATNGNVTVGANGAVRATGAGGDGGEVQAGGGGGGSGGYIRLEGAVVTVDGNLAANGGGGGEGGVRFDFSDVSGDPGDDGDLGTSAAAGGTGTDFAGDGGAGAPATGTDLDGASSQVGAGGGGGGAGVIEVSGSLQGSGVVSPAAASIGG